MAASCPYCGTTEGLRQIHDGGGYMTPEITCEDCFTPRDDGPCFDDLQPLVVPCGQCASLADALARLVNAKALAEVRSIVAGWNGENRPEGPHAERHPSRLGATLRTNCGEVYALDEAMTSARAALALARGEQ